MRREPPLPQELWGQIPPLVQAALWLVVEGYEQRLAGLEAEVGRLKSEVQELSTQLGQNSQNSSRPPSSDGPQVKRKPPTAPSGRKRGGQPGHRVPQRVLLPVEQVDETHIPPAKPGV
jgi:transposase